MKTTSGALRRGHRQTKQVQKLPRKIRLPARAGRCRKTESCSHRKPAGENPSQPSTGAVNVQSTSTSVGLLARPGRGALSKELPADRTALDASARVNPAASQDPATDPTERVFRLSKQLKTIESDVEADRVFQ